MSEKLVSNEIRIVWKKGTANNVFCWNERLKKKYKNAHIQIIDGSHNKYRKVMFLACVLSAFPITYIYIYNMCVKCMVFPKNLL